MSDDTKIEAVTMLEATEAEERAAFDEALEIGALPSFVLARRGLRARVPVSVFLEEVEQRARAERIPCDRILENGGKTWLSLSAAPGLTISVFSPGGWIVSVQVQGSPGLPQSNPEKGIELAAEGARLVRVLMGSALCVDPPPSGEIPF
jgi:hypothetical protein